MLVYIHIPFCSHKCPYCDFNSHVRREVPWARYGAVLERELRGRLQQPQWRGRTAETVYFGGGTPSLAPPGLVDDLLALLRGAGVLSEQAEVSLEVNPGSLDEAKLDRWRAAGVNRLSIGVQSLDAVQLRWLERIHSVEEGREALVMARRHGWENIGIDLIYGLPDQSLAQWRRQLEAVMAWRPDHLSCYQLTVEEGTPLAARHAARPYPLPDQDVASEMLLWTRSALRAAGWQPYEISNYARPGAVCRHNDGYWRYADYLAVGAGACGKYDLDDGSVRRYRNRRHPEGYMEAVERGAMPEAEVEVRSRRQAAAEAVWLGLRRTGGITVSRFRARFGADPNEMFRESLTPWMERGQLLCNGTMHLGEDGILLADSIAAGVLAEEVA